MKTFALTIFLSITSVFANSDCGWEFNIFLRSSNRWKCNDRDYDLFKIQDIVFSSGRGMKDENGVSTINCYDETSTLFQSGFEKFKNYQRYSGCIDSSLDVISVESLNAKVRIKSPSGVISRQINFGESTTLCLNNNACDQGESCLDFQCISGECFLHSHCGEGQYCVNNACSDEPCGWKYKMTSLDTQCDNNDEYSFQWGSQSILLTGPNGHMCDENPYGQVIDWQNSICPPENIMVKVYMNMVSSKLPAIDIITPSGMTLSFAKSSKYSSTYNPSSLCSSTAACPTGQYCLAGDCGENECFSDNDCGSGRYCLNNLCSDEPCGWKIFTSVVSDSCSAATTIQISWASLNRDAGNKNLCVPGQTHDWDSNVCPPEDQLVKFYPLYGYEIELTSPSGKKIQLAGSYSDYFEYCFSDAVCPTGEKCLDGECTTDECRKHEHCPEGEFCKGKQCGSEACQWKIESFASNGDCFLEGFEVEIMGCDECEIVVDQDDPAKKFLCDNVGVSMDWDPRWKCPPNDAMVKIHGPLHYNEDRLMLTLTSPSGTNITSINDLQIYEQCTSTAICEQLTPEKPFCVGGVLGSKGVRTQCKSYECTNDGYCYSDNRRVCDTNIERCVGCRWYKSDCASDEYCLIDTCKPADLNGDFDRDGVPDTEEAIFDENNNFVKERNNIFRDLIENYNYNDTDFTYVDAYGYSRTGIQIDSFNYKIADSDNDGLDDKTELAIGTLVGSSYNDYVRIRYCAPHAEYDADKCHSCKSQFIGGRFRGTNRQLPDSELKCNDGWWSDYHGTQSIQDNTGAPGATFIRNQHSDNPDKKCCQWVDRQIHGGGFSDIDGDGIRDVIDPDMDGDGLNNTDEVAGTFGYVTDPKKADTDGDGLTDKEEIDGSRNNGVSTNPSDWDTDRDDPYHNDNLHSSPDNGVCHVGIPKCIMYSDNTKMYSVRDDGTCSGFDSLKCIISSDLQEIEGSSNVYFNNEPTDPNNSDEDGDELLDGTEMLPYDWFEYKLSRNLTVSNPRVVDTDGDALKDNQEWGGQLTNFSVLGPRIKDPDMDGDGIADLVDPDIDGDGLTNEQETSGSENTVYDNEATNPRMYDTDNDGVSDYQEILNSKNVDYSGIFNDATYGNWDLDEFSDRSDPDLDNDGIDNEHDKYPYDPDHNKDGWIDPNPKSTISDSEDFYWMFHVIYNGKRQCNEERCLNSCYNYKHYYKYVLDCGNYDWYSKCRKYEDSCDNSYSVSPDETKKNCKAASCGTPKAVKCMRLFNAYKRLECAITSTDLNVWENRGYRRNQCPSTPIDEWGDSVDYYGDCDFLIPFANVCNADVKGWWVGRSTYWLDKLCGDCA